MRGQLPSRSRPCLTGFPLPGSAGEKGTGVYRHWFLRAGFECLRIRGQTFEPRLCCAACYGRRMSEHLIRRAACPGSYDPVTCGHLDVVARAAALFDEVFVVVLHNPAKQGLFSPDERVALVEAEIQERGLAGRVQVRSYAGRLLVDVCSELGVSAIVKGLRGETDYAYELPMAVMNRRLSGVETLFVPGSPEFVEVSSSLMKEVAGYGGDVTGLVPPRVQAALMERLNS